LQEGESVIEPLSYHEVINDLVVEHSTFHDRLGMTRAFHARPDFLNNELEKFNWPKRFQDLTNCIECLACESICPAFGNSQSDFPGPALLVQLAKSLSHPKSYGNEEHVAWIDGIHNCIACMKCTYVCPKNVDPFRNGILSLRSAIKKQQL
jgi:succinate dehydrogenase/fumarate reductase iron-sulfur protein